MKYMSTKSETKVKGWCNLTIHFDFLITYPLLAKKKKF